MLLSLALNGISISTTPLNAVKHNNLQVVDLANKQQPTSSRDSPSLRILFTGDLHLSPRAAKVVTAVKEEAKKASSNGQNLISVIAGDTHNTESSKNLPLALWIDKLIQNAHPEMGNYKILGNQETYVSPEKFAAAVFACENITPYFASNLDISPETLNEKTKAVQGYSTEQLIQIYQTLIDQKKIISKPVLYKTNNTNYGFISLLLNPKPEKEKKHFCHSFCQSEDNTNKTLAEQIQILKNNNANKIILVVHRGGEWVRNFVARNNLAKDIDVIISSDDHKEVNEVLTTPDGKTILHLNSGAYGQKLGVLDIDDKGMQARLLETDAYKEDEEVLSKFKEFHGKDALETLIDLQKKPLTLVESLQIKYLQSTEIGSDKKLLAAIQLLANQAKAFIDKEIPQEKNISMIRSSEFRDPSDQGCQINASIVRMILGCDDSLVKVSVTGQELINLVKENLNLIKANVQFLLFAGLDYELDSNNELKSVFFIANNGNKENIKETENYNLVFSNYLLRKWGDILTDSIKILKTKQACHYSSKTQADLMIEALKALRAT